MGDARLVVFGRDHRHVVRQLARDQLEELEPRRMDAVVIGEKDSHGRSFRTGSAWRRGASCGKTTRATLRPSRERGGPPQRPSSASSAEAQAPARRLRSKTWAKTEA